jgi:hypothetical protein
VKISQIITEQYENQDPNRPADVEENKDGSLLLSWLDNSGRLHRDGDMPAYIDTVDGTREWYQHGLMHRDGDMPAYVGYDGTQLVFRVWYQRGNVHRENAPAVINEDGAVEFWSNGKRYKNIDKWAEQVGMRKHEMLIMKHKLGLD